MRWFHQYLPGFLADLPDDKDDNEVKPEAGIYFMAEKNLGKFQLKCCLKAVRPVIASNGVHFSIMKLIGSHQLAMVKKERKEGRKRKWPDESGI